MTRGLTAAVLLSAVCVTGCESTQARSARIARAGHGSAAAQTLREGPANSSVHVTQTTLVSASGAVAAVVRLHNGGRSQANVPILVDARDASGRVVYRNDIQGLDPALQGISLLRAGADAYWVNDQVSATPPPRSLRVRVGRAQAAVTARPPRIVVDQVQEQRESGANVVTGRVATTSTAVQRNVAIYCVAVRGRRIVAAGRALVPRVHGKPVGFNVYLVGNPKGARLVFTAPPTVLAKGASMATATEG